MISFHLFPQHTAPQNVMPAEQRLAHEMMDSKANKVRKLMKIREHSGQLLSDRALPTAWRAIPASCQAVSVSTLQPRALALQLDTVLMRRPRRLPLNCPAKRSMRSEISPGAEPR